MLWKGWRFILQSFLHSNILYTYSLVKPCEKFCILNVPVPIQMAVVKLKKLVYLYTITSNQILVMLSAWLRLQSKSNLLGKFYDY